MPKVYQIYIYDAFVYIGVIADEAIKRTTTKSISRGVYRIYGGYIQAL